MIRCPLPGCGVRMPCAAHRPSRGPILEVQRGAAIHGAIQSRNRKVGEASEEVVAGRLRDLGALQVVSIDVGWRIQRQPGGKIIGATPKAKVAGDVRCVLPGGRSVLCEVKWTSAVAPGAPLVLNYGRLDKQQVDRLNEHHQAGALSLLAWVSPGTCFLLRWPVAGFRPRSSLSFQAAAGLNLTSLKGTHAQ